MQRYDRHLPEYLRSIGVDPKTDCVLRDDGEGPWIHQWFLCQPQPTPEEVAKYSPPPRVEVDLSANVTASLATALRPGKVIGATPTAKANAALDGLEAMAEQLRNLIAALKAKEVL